ncbi:MAG: LysE family transporter [Idiomarina sp.]|nr:LysE family transporter [Idiomarina sp.]
MTQYPYLIEFLAMALAHLLAVMSPGPDFAVVSRYSVCYGARIAVYVSLGIGLGILIHITYSVLGLALVISQTPWLYAALLLCAAGYFFWLGKQLIFTKPPLVSPVKNSDNLSESKRDPAGTPPSIARAVGIGFLTNGLNIKATMFFLALFTSIISPQTPLIVKAGYGIYLAIATFTWFACVSLLLGRTRLRGWLLSHGYWFDRVMGGLLWLLALNLLWQWFRA